MDTEREANTAEKKAPETLSIDPNERRDWDFDLSRPNGPSNMTLQAVGVRDGATNGTNDSENTIADDELIIQEPKTLIRGQMRVALVGGGRDRPIIVLDEEVCPE